MKRLELCRLGNTFLHLDQDTDGTYKIVNKALSPSPQVLMSNISISELSKFVSVLTHALNTGAISTQNIKPNDWVHTDNNEYVKVESITEPVAIGKVFHCNDGKHYFINQVSKWYPKDGEYCWFFSEDGNYLLGRYEAGDIDNKSDSAFKSLDTLNYISGYTESDNPDISSSPIYNSTNWFDNIEPYTTKLPTFLSKIK